MKNSNSEKKLKVNDKIFLNYNIKPDYKWILVQIVVFFLFITPISGYSQNADSAWIVNNYNKKEQYVPMRDGVKLFTSIYIPKDTGEKHPILITRTTYSCMPYGDNFRNFWSNHYKEYLKEKYIIVVQDVRGKFMSEGIFVDVRPFNPDKKSPLDIDESTDTYDTVDWLIRNIQGNNGKVGVFGTSYPGFYSTQAALSNHPAIVAVSPQAPVTDWFIGDDFHHNGAFFLMDAFGFYTEWGFGSPRPKPTKPTPDLFQSAYTPPTKDYYDFYLRTGALPNFTKLTGDSISFWKELMSHPNYDSFWKARNVRAAITNIKAATLEVGGLFDAEDCFGAWNTYRAIEKQSPSTNNKIVMGPWSHGQWATPEGTHLGNVQFGSNTSEWYAANIEIPFFNYYLKGKGNIDQIKEATIFFTGENQWKQFSNWPPKASTEKAIFLQENGKLNWEQPKTEASFSEYISNPAKPVPYTEGIHANRTAEYMTGDQRFASSRPDVLVFKSEILSEDVTLAGPLTAELMVSISTTDADFVVKLIDVFPDDFAYTNDNDYIMNGYQMMVRGDVFRGKYRNSFEKPEPFIPGKITSVKYTMPDVAHTFKKGHRIMVQVQSSWFPLVDRNPQKFIDIYHARDTDFQQASIRVYHDKVNNSKILLPVLK